MVRHGLLEGRSLVCLATFALTFVASPTRAQVLDDPPPVDIPIQNIQQQTQVWCWAAVAQQIILQAVGPERTPQQCALVAVANNAPPAVCCGGYNPACVRTGSIEQIQALIRAFGGTYSRQAPPADPLVLYRTLEAGRPIILQIAPTPQTRHVVVLRGMSFVRGPFGTVPMLHINDPMATFTQPVPFATLMPMWVSAIVVDPSWQPRDLSRGLARYGSGAELAPQPARGDDAVLNAPAAALGEEASARAAPARTSRGWCFEYREQQEKWQESRVFLSKSTCEDARRRKESSGYEVGDCAEVVVR